MNTFFKPYRERIHDMFQHHDSLQMGEDGAGFAPSQYQRNYSPYFHNQYRYSYSPSPERNGYAPRYRETNFIKHTNTDKKKGRKTYRQMHQPVWQHLYSNGMQAQKDQLQAHQLQKNKIDIQCTFQPMIRKNSRYMIPSTSNFLQRNYIWQQNKIDKIVKEKQQQVIKGLQDCTFKPKINTYYKLKSNKYSHKNINPKDNRLSKSAIKLPNKTNMHHQDLKKTEQSRQKSRRAGREGINRQEVGKIKHLIRNELKRIQL